MSEPARRSAFDTFVSSEAAGGLVLMASAFVAIVVANSPLAEAYFGLLHVYIGGLSVLHWVNDGLMVVFFLLVGLEIKHELIGGRLSAWSDRALPGFAALGGMVVPALIYVALNAGTPETMRGWAIPSATDIAFSLGVLALLGSRAPLSLKIFLTALAILDDLGAVLIIALFYTAGLSLPMLGLAAGTFAILVALNRFGVKQLAPYLLLGVALWLLVMKSGIHATIAGVLLAATIPTAKGNGVTSGHPAPLERLRHVLEPWVAFAILPIFGFANAGVSLAGLDLAVLTHPVTLGVALGLFAGKQIGVFGAAWLAVRLGFGNRPEGANWTQVYGVAALCGIGFTMSLFIGILAFGATEALQDETKIGVLIGSLASAIVGWAVLKFSPGPAASS